MDSDDERLEIDMSNGPSSQPSCADGGAGGDWGLRCAESGPWQGRAALLPSSPVRTPQEEDLCADRGGDGGSREDDSVLWSGLDGDSPTGDADVPGPSPASGADTEGEGPLEEGELEDGELEAGGEDGSVETAADNDDAVIEEEFLEVAKHVIPALEELEAISGGDSRDASPNKVTRKTGSDKKRQRRSKEAHAEKRPCSPELLDDDSSVYVRGASPVQCEWPKWSDYDPVVTMDYGTYYQQYQPGYGATGHRPKKRRLDKHKRKSDSICSFFMQGSCFKGKKCLFSHKAIPPYQKMELCKFYARESCFKRDHCSYLHKSFPCKLFHTGAQCLTDSECKFSHEPLTDVTRSILLKHIESAPEDILGDFPRMYRTLAQRRINVALAQRRKGLEPDFTFPNLERTRFTHIATDKRSATPPHRERRSSESRSRRDTAAEAGDGERGGRGTERRRRRRHGERRRPRDRRVVTVCEPAEPMEVDGERGEGQPGQPGQLPVLDGGVSVEGAAGADDVLLGQAVDRRLRQLRLQQQQLSGSREPTPQPTDDDAPPADDHWYSSDEDGPPLTDVLRRISEESIEAKFSPATSEEGTPTSGDDGSDAAADDVAGTADDVTGTADDDTMDPVEAISQLLKAIQNSTTEEDWRSLGEPPSQNPDSSVQHHPPQDTGISGQQRPTTDTDYSGLLRPAQDNDYSVHQGSPRSTGQHRSPPGNDAAPGTADSDPSGACQMDTSSDWTESPQANDEDLRLRDEDMRPRDKFGFGGGDVYPRDEDLHSKDEDLRVRVAKTQPKLRSRDQHAYQDMDVSSRDEGLRAGHSPLHPTGLCREGSPRPRAALSLPRGDRDLRLTGTPRWPGTDDLSLPFAPVHFQPCVEIDASVATGGVRLPWRLTGVLASGTDYARLRQRPPAAASRSDPRLRTPPPPPQQREQQQQQQQRRRSGEEAEQRTAPDPEGKDDREACGKEGPGTVTFKGPTLGQMQAMDQNNGKRTETPSAASTVEQTMALSCDPFQKPIDPHQVAQHLHIPRGPHQVPQDSNVPLRDPRQVPQDVRPRDPRQASQDPHVPPRDPRQAAQDSSASRDPRQVPQDPRVPRDPRQVPQDPHAPPRDPRQGPNDPKRAPVDPRQANVMGPCQNMSLDTNLPKDPRQLSNAPKGLPVDPRQTNVMGPCPKPATPHLPPMDTSHCGIVPASPASLLSQPPPPGVPQLTEQPSVGQAAGMTDPRHQLWMTASQQTWSGPQATGVQPQTVGTPCYPPPEQVFYQTLPPSQQTSQQTSQQPLFYPAPPPSQQMLHQPPPVPSHRLQGHQLNQPLAAQQHQPLASHQLHQPLANHQHQPPQIPAQRQPQQAPSTQHLFPAYPPPFQHQLHQTAPPPPVGRSSSQSHQLHQPLAGLHQAAPPEPVGLPSSQTHQLQQPPAGPHQTAPPQPVGPPSYRPQTSQQQQQQEQQQHDLQQNSVSIAAPQPAPPQQKQQIYQFPPVYQRPPPTIQQSLQQPTHQQPPTSQQSRAYQHQPPSQQPGPQTAQQQPSPNQQSIYAQKSTHQQPGYQQPPSSQQPGYHQSVRQPPPPPSPQPLCVRHPTPQQPKQQQSAHQPLPNQQPGHQQPPPNVQLGYQQPPPSQHSGYQQPPPSQQSGHQQPPLGQQSVHEIPLPPTQPKPKSGQQQPQTSQQLAHQPPPPPPPSQQPLYQQSAQQQQPVPGQQSVRQRPPSQQTVYQQQSQSSQPAVSVSIAGRAGRAGGSPGLLGASPTRPAVPRPLLAAGLPPGRRSAATSPVLSRPLLAAAGRTPPGGLLPRPGASLLGRPPPLLATPVSRPTGVLAARGLSAGSGLH
ncbi:uncharacterized protein LOC122394511 isoform X2 [Amphibalanus amphitrite]|nr:uncharacterized protein LOC122394511 isoform X2 [Amphibalanus amphitrite]